MRAKTKKKHEMGRRFAILIGVAAAGVMALGAQTASSTTGDPVDSTPPDLQLSGPKKQDPQNDEGCGTNWCRLEVRVSCDEVCTVRATGKLTNVKMDKLDPVGPSDMCPPTPPIGVCEGCGETGPACPPSGAGPVRPGPDGTRNLGPWLLKKEQRKQVREALADGENIKAKVAVKATDAAGNVATAKRTITLVK